MNQAFLDLLFSNMRITHERKGDFNTMLGTSRKAAEHLAAVVSGVSEAAPCSMRSTNSSPGRRASRASASPRCPTASTIAEGYIEGDGNSTEPLGRETEADHRRGER